MTDTFITLLIVGACAVFLGIRSFRSFKGKGNGCGCSCSGGCSSSVSSPDDQSQIQTDIQPMSRKE